MRRYRAGSLVGSHFSSSSSPPLLLLVVLALGCGAQEEPNNNNNNNNNSQLSCGGVGGGDDNAAVTWICVAVVAVVLVVVGVIAWKQRGQNTWLGGGAGLPCCWKPEKNLVLETVNDKTEKNKDHNVTEYVINNGNFGEITPVTAQVSIRFEKTLDANRTVSAEHRFLDELQSLTARYPGIIVDVVPPASNDAAAAAKNSNNGGGGSVRNGIVKCYRSAVSAVRQRIAAARSGNISPDGVTQEQAASATKTTCSNTSAEQTTLDEPDGERRETVIQIMADDAGHHRAATEYHSLEYCAAAAAEAEQSPRREDHPGRGKPCEGVSKETGDKPGGRDDPEARGAEPTSKTETKSNIGGGAAEVTVVCERKTFGDETSSDKRHRHATGGSIDEQEDNDFKEVPLNDNVAVVDTGVRQQQNRDERRPVAAVNGVVNVGRQEEMNGKEKSPPPPPPPRKHSSLATAESANRVVVASDNNSSSSLRETETEKSPPLSAADHHDHGKVVVLENGENDDYALDNTDNSSADDGVSYNINDITDSGILIEDTTIPSSSDEDMDNVGYPSPTASPRNAAAAVYNDDDDDDDSARRNGIGGAGGGDKTVGSKKLKTPPIVKSNFKLEPVSSSPPVCPDIKEEHRLKYAPDSAEQQKMSAVVVGTTKVPRVIQSPQKSSVASTIGGGTAPGNALVSPSKIPVRRSSSGNSGLSGATGTPGGATVPSKKWSPSATNGSVSKLINT